MIVFLTVYPLNGYFLMKIPQIILITGASSGLGAALALHYARPGVTLHLQGRNEERLAAVAHQAKLRGAEVHEKILDVADGEAMRAWIGEIDDKTPVDLAIANAGISAGFGSKGESFNQVKAIFAANVDGVIHTIQPLAARMTKRGSGQLAVMSSLAGVRALPSCPAYSASKAAVKSYGEALRGALASKGVGVSVICPGYIRTPMTAKNPFPMPLLMNADKAAAIIARGLAKNNARIVFPLPLYLLLWFISCLSVRITDPIFARLPAKPAQS